VATRPELAVIVGAYRRATYVADAVRSVLAQGVPRDRFEVLVTKNFRDPEVDRFLAENGVRTRFDDDPRIGPWLARAVRDTSAPLVAFLDDDDQFEPDRLGHVLEVFRAHPALGFYRNRVRVIGARGEPVPPERWREVEQDATFDRSGPVYAPDGAKTAVAQLLRSHPSVAFNSSTMVVRRDLLTGPFASAFEGSQLPDLALFLLGLLGPTAMYLDDRRLTRFRYYQENVTHQVGWLRHAADSNRELGEFAGGRGERELAAWLGATADHYQRMFLGSTVAAKMAAGCPRREVARAAGAYVRYLADHPAERGLTLAVWSAAVYGAAYSALPGLARRLESFRPTRRIGRR